MKVFVLWIIATILLVSSLQAPASIYGRRLCKLPGYQCVHVKRGQTWFSLWPDPYQRDVVKRLNRMNIPLLSGMVIAVPQNPNTTALDIAPFVHQISPLETKTIIVSLDQLAWGAYAEDGKLVKWGPVSGGKGYCPDIDSACHTKTGVFSISEKRGPECISTKFPVDEGGGAPMPYCMFYSDGYALHGSPQVPGYNASHGCVRLFIEDARWLNREFTNEGAIKVIVLPQAGVSDEEEQ